MIRALAYAACGFVIGGVLSHYAWTRALSDFALENDPEVEAAIMAEVEDGIEQIEYYLSNR